MKNSNDVTIQLNCNHGLPSENSPKFSHLPDAVWFFDDITWYRKHFRCSSLEYVRWFWSMGWLLGKKRYKLDGTRVICRVDPNAGVHLHFYSYCMVQKKC